MSTTPDVGHRTRWDVIVVGAGAGGMSTAIFAARRGARVLVVDAAAEEGGALHIATGQLSAAGTRLQRSKGIEDTPEAHLADIMRISRNTADRELAWLAVSNAAATVDWLLDDLGMPVLPDHPVRGQNHEHYSQDRYYWGPDLGRSILTAVRAPFRELIDSGAITALFNTEVIGLTQEPAATGGRVTGIITRPTGATTANHDTHRGTNLVLATGGYNADPALFEKMNGVPAYADASYRYAKGAGHQLGVEAGGYTRNHDLYLCSFGSVLDHDAFPAPVLCRPIHWPEMRMPWEIYVNVEGRRFIAEDEPSVDVREHALLRQTDLRRYIVLDERMLREAPPMIPDWTADDVRARAGHHPMFHVADDLRTLATSAGIDADNLVATVAEYNACLDGDDPLGRTFRPLPITEAPFYAIRVQGMSITSTAGLAVDTDLRVIRPDGTPIPGLYALGELLGSGAFMGNSFCGGMLATPALTFGRLLGTGILAW
ncbi:FAD-dependent oxidoreductase [Micromonospora globbae]|uniref:FAD-dependent oxidoreductase n=1 Tax=Micromonospora globbae TaxID=1894969 RepID=A0ABZ1SFU8_9ACTN|nr:FAD-dependent oxidoreductase [Micromonospora globbae]